MSFGFLGKFWIDIGGNPRFYFQDQNSSRKKYKTVFEETIFGKVNAKIREKLDKEKND